MKTADQMTSIHRLGVTCGLVAGVWLGAAEAPTKLVGIGLSPFAISLCMVAGVFTARWTFPTLLKGTTYVWADLMSKKHLIVWALLAGALWAVANTLTVFAIRDVGLAVAFPMWNANALIGLFWARVLFRELEGASGKVIFRVLLGALMIVAAAIMLGFSSMHGANGAQSQHSVQGIVAALGACLMWGTMYVPYRKAYLSGMNPLSFVTAFTVGELATVGTLAVTLGGGFHAMKMELQNAHSVLFWLFLGGFVWVIGDLFQQFATKYLGIGRGIPLSNTNQLWGLVWAALVFHELAGVDRQHKLLLLIGSIAMIAGASLISSAAASGKEHSSRNEAILRECDRYGLDYFKTLSAMAGKEFSKEKRRRWWDYAIVLAATSIFVVLGLQVRAPALAINKMWVGVLAVLLILSLAAGAIKLWRTTRFS
jgi:drug/metabolite transporter (DMT)-like permease